tara:strand:+ start:609 stop:944 length:336 start_codon:yes stop_codon:yes gene_type:complete
MTPLNLNMDRYTKPTTDAPHELSEAVNMIEQAGLFTEKYNRGYWLKLVSYPRWHHPVEEIRLLLKTMHDRKDWLLKEKKEVMNRGGWLTNRLKEAASGPKPKSMVEPDSVR